MWLWSIGRRTGLGQPCKNINWSASRVWWSNTAWEIQSVQHHIAVRRSTRLWNNGTQYWYCGTEYWYNRWSRRCVAHTSPVIYPDAWFLLGKSLLIRLINLIPGELFLDFTSRISTSVPVPGLWRLRRCSLGRTNWNKHERERRHDWGVFRDLTPLTTCL